MIAVAFFSTQLRINNICGHYIVIICLMTILTQNNLCIKRKVMLNLFAEIGLIGEDHVKDTLKVFFLAWKSALLLYFTSQLWADIILFYK